MDLDESLKRIDLLKEEAEKLLPAKPEFDKIFWDKFRLEFNYNSNHIEGNTLTFGQTKLLLLFDRTTGDHKGREIEEMKAHDVALKMITALASDPENRLTEKLIREINEIILVRPFYNDAITPDGKPTKRLITPGEYKKHPNSVLLPDGNMFYYASPAETPALMGDLIEWYNQNKDKTHPVRLAALVHYNLVRIHPFDDSNGRTTRLIMNFILMQNGYAPIVIESKKKDMYLAALNKADVGDIGAFEQYIAEVSAKWQETFLKAIKGEKVEEEGDFDKEVELLKKRISHDKKPTKRISQEVIDNFLTGPFIKLIDSLINKLSKFDSFAYEKVIYFGINSTLIRLQTEDYLGHMLTILSDNSQKIYNGGTVNFQYILEGVGTNRNMPPINIYTEMLIRFIEFTYSIEVENLNVLVQKRYDEELTATEIEQLALDIGKRTLDKIKEYA